MTNVFLAGSQLLTYCFSSTGDYLIPVTGGLVRGEASGVQLLWDQTTNDVTSNGFPTHPLC